MDLKKCIGQGSSRKKGVYANRVTKTSVLEGQFTKVWAELRETKKGWSRNQDGLATLGSGYHPCLKGQKKDWL